jgi:glycosyltransferase involved in cell wall biosynthesis
MFLDHYPSPGGTTTAVTGLGKALVRSGEDVVMLGHGAEFRSCNDGELTGLIFDRPAARPFGRPNPRLCRYLRDNVDGLDILILNGIFSPALAYLARCARAGNIVLVLAPHDPYHSDLFAKSKVRKHIYWHAVEKKLLRYVDGVQVLSPRHGNLLEGRSITTPILLVPNGVSSEQLNSCPMASKADGPALRLGHLGRIDKWHKGLDLLVHAIGALKASGYEVVLEIAGRGGTDHHHILTIVKHLGLEREVLLKGPVDGSSTEIIRTWDALVVGSRFDGFPQTVLEAMVARRPVICSAAAGAADYVDDSGCGLVVQPSVTGIALGIARFSAQRASWDAMGERGRKYVETTLTWQRIAETAMCQYESLVSSCRPIKGTWAVPDYARTEVT